MRNKHNFQKDVLNTRLMANFAHSIRNPLASIKMRLYSLGRLNLPEAQKEDLAVIVEEISNIETLTHNFLKFSRTLKIKTELTSPSDVVDKAMRLLRPDIENRKARIDLYRSQRLPEVLIDTERLKEVFSNLIINGIEASSNGNRRVFINEKEVRKPKLGHLAIIEIIDNGRGMPDHVKNRLFEPFFTTKMDGTGLGLCIARQIVEAHGGGLTFSTCEDKGSIFTVTLPYD